ncbi:MAG: CotH kinase family protein, partial [Bacteroidales bacterium]|nr:CotH kinase family protein [Bacteroidales bacterium]
MYKNVCLTGNRPNYTWILDAAFIDPARVRNRVSFGVWAGMGISTTHQAIQGQAVELFRNLQHQGLYSLNENFNSEVLGLSGSDDVLYKA